jgi:hypothetical protein
LNDLNEKAPSVDKPFAFKMKFVAVMTVPLEHGGVYIHESETEPTVEEAKTAFLARLAKDHGVTQVTILQFDRSPEDDNILDTLPDADQTPQENTEKVTLN